jgi:protein-S-isoprenylcysteine O-methyltransferase Ste14
MSYDARGDRIQHWWEPNQRVKETMDQIVVAVLAVVIVLAAVYFGTIVVAVMWQGYLAATGNMWFGSTVVLLLFFGVYLCLRK